MRLVRVCARRARLAHRGRALCGAAGAALLVLALCALGGRALGDGEALLLSALVGLLAFVAWSRSARFDEDEVAATLHRAFPGAGLLASYERAADGERSPLSELAAFRAYRSVPAEGARAATCPAAVPFIALPVAATLALVLGVEARDARARVEAGAATVEAFARGLGNAQRTLAPVLDAPARDALERMAAQVASSGAGGVDPGVDPGDARAWARTFEELAAEQDPAAADALQSLALTAELLAPPAEDDGSDRDVGEAPAGNGRRTPQDAGASAAGADGRATGSGPGAGREADGGGAGPDRDDGRGGPPGGVSAAEGAAGTDASSEAVDTPAGSGAPEPRAVESGPGADGSTPGGSTPAGALDPGRPEALLAGQHGLESAPVRAGLPARPIPARHLPIVRAWLARTR
ncbi:MAG: hypothetical protein AAFU73_14530 [Planctomycetota bacterium]